jgi:hypothetical protein
MPARMRYMVISLSDYTVNNILFMYSQKRFCRASLLTAAKYFQNRIIIFCLELWEVLYVVLHAASQLSAQHITKRSLQNFSSTGDSYFQIRTIKMVPWICYFLFENIYLLFGIEVWLIPFWIMYSKSLVDRWIFNIFSTMKKKSFMETFTPYTQILIFEE